MNASPQSALLLLAALLGGCSEGEQEGFVPPAATPQPSDEVMLEVAGLSLTRGDLDAASAHIKASMPAAGRKARWRLVLESLLQDELFQRDYGDRFPALKERAQALVDATRNGGYPELVRQGEAFGGFQEELPYARSSLPAAVEPFAFDMANLGQVSDPIRVPQGYLVASCELLEQGTTTDQDRAHVYLVPFFVMPGQAFGNWWADVKARLQEELTTVHPDMEGALPPWLRRR